MRPELEFLAKPINSQDDAENFILALDDAGFLFHFDDSPDEIVYVKDGIQCRTFTDEEVPYVKARIEELFMHLEDPFAVALELTMATDETRSFGPRK
jgi:hypothetical protein